MLPNSVDVSNEPLPSKYADTAITALLNGKRQLKAKRRLFPAKIAGVANMFENLNTENLELCGKNVKQVKNVLSNHGVG